MQRGQSAQLRDGGFIQGKRRDEMIFALRRDELRGRLRQGQFAETVFNGDFPERNRAQENLIVRVTNRGGNIGGQFRRRRIRAREIRRCPAGFSFALKRLQNVFRQRGVEIIRHRELAVGETDGARLRQRRRGRGW